jgi:hypothetical protein
MDTGAMVEDPSGTLQNRMDIETAWTGEQTMLAITDPSICTTRVALGTGTTITILSMATRKPTEPRTATVSAEDTRRVIASMAAVTTGDRLGAARADPQ